MNENKANGIYIEGLTKSFASTKIFENLSCHFPKDQVSLLIGKNGSGKSTLLKTLAGTEVYQSGRLTINGMDCDHDRLQVLDTTFFVSENFNFTLPHHLGELPDVFGTFYSRWSDERYLKYLRTFGLSPHAFFGQLSRGQRMQLLCTIALATQPKVLLLDEMTSVLDAHARHLLLEEMDKICKEGCTVILATNLVIEARELANPRIFVLRQGAVGELSAETLRNFVKIKIKRGVSLPANFWRIPAQKNGDGSVSYISSRTEIEKLTSGDFEIDRRQNSVEDFFTYHSALEGMENEKAA